MYRPRPIEETDWRMRGAGRLTGLENGIMCVMSGFSGFVES